MTGQATLYNQLTLIIRGVMIESIRRKHLYILLMVMGIFLCGVFAVSLAGIHKAATAAFLLNLGMSLAGYCAHILTLSLALRQIPDELDNRTLYPLLARPVRRTTLLYSKWLACTLCGSLVLFLLFLMGWMPVPNKGNIYSVGLLIQLLMLQLCSIGLLAALAVMLSLFVPRGLNLVLCAGWYFFGQNIATLIRNSLHANTTQPIVAWLLAYLPDFSKLNLIVRYTDGIAALDWPAFLGLLTYSAVFIAFVMLMAALRFDHRQL